MDWFAELGNLNFTRPTSLWWLALVVPVLVAHLMRSRPRRLLVPDLSLWEEYLAQAHGKQSFESLQEIFALLLRIAALLALALAAAGAFLGPLDADPPGLEVAVVIDTSASMAACDLPDGRSRLEHARELALDLVADRLRPVDRYALLTTSGDVWGSDLPRNVLLAAIHRLRVQPRRTHDLAGTVTLARELLSPTSIGRVLLVGDGSSKAELERARDAVPQLVFVSVGVSGENLAILEVEEQVAPADVEGEDQDLRGLGAPLAHHIQVRVANYAEREASVTLEGLGEDVEPPVFTLSPTSERTFALEVPGERAALALRVVGDLDDSYPADDRAYLGLVPLRPARVLVASEARTDVAWVAAGLAALGGAIDRRASVQTSLERLAGAELGDLLPDVVITVGGTLPPGLPAVSVLLLGATAPELGVRTQGRLSNPLAWEISSTHPVTAGVSLAELVASQAIHLDLDDRFEVLAEDSQGRPLIAVAPRADSPAHTVIVSALPLNGTNLVQLAAFPIFLSNSLGEIQRRADRTIEGVYETGDVLRSARPVRADRPVPVRLLSDSPGAAGQRLAPAVVEEGRLAYADTGRPGLYAFDLEGTTRFAGVNAPFSLGESAIAPQPSESALADVTAGALPLPTRQPLVEFLLLGAAVAFVLDALLFAAGRGRRGEV